MIYTESEQRTLDERTGAELDRRERAKPCTCHPSEAPVPCERRYAFTECLIKAQGRREGAEEALREAAEWHKAEAAKARSEADRLSDWGRWWRGDETWRDRAELHERAAAHLLGETGW